MVSLLWLLIAALFGLSAGTPVASAESVPSVSTVSPAPPTSSADTETD